MTVAELIAALKKVPQDAEVVTTRTDANCCDYLADVEDVVLIDGDKPVVDIR